MFLISAEACFYSDNCSRYCFSGLLLPNEQFVIENMKSSENIYFVPMVWATTIVERARKEGRIKGEILVLSVLNASIRVILI